MNTDKAKKFIDDLGMFDTMQHSLYRGVEPRPLSELMESYHQHRMKEKVEALKNLARYDLFSLNDLLALDLRDAIKILKDGE